MMSFLILIVAAYFGLIDERIAFGDIVHVAAPVCGDPC